ncbi:hypothetical protein ILUMI_09537 [Ignelater luminosus]|uniref:Nitrilase and fragile histidine triad fusion protein NitFhit n=1 Tax=Ignelater luminosus TaxID=2038154 RepID=A0A8K0CZS9_IGNLU|nr:hypothetical protein ILUMI_09537 [Ignelater luminosus]
MNSYLLLHNSIKRRNYFKIFQFARCLSKIMSSETCKIAVCQFTATNVKADNFKIVQQLVSEASQKNVQMVFLPEACDYMARNKDEIKNLAETFSGDLMTKYRELAQKYNVWLSIGGFHEVVETKDGQKLYNSHVLLDQQGEIKAVYRKMHLFDVSLPEKNINLKESSYVLPGPEVVPPVDSPIGPLGLGVCYDIRFPEFSIILRKMGASILTFPSAFTNTTGQAHWEILLRARAIENQCYVIAAAQYGCHNTSRTSFGHAMVVDPWGKIIAECPKYIPEIPSDQSIAIADIDMNLITQIRQEMPVFQHRRNDIYKLITINNELPLQNNKNHYMFADKEIPIETVFYSTQYSYAFTNIRCVVPGHVLVSTVRQAKRLEDLTAEEVADFFQTAIKAQKAVERANSSTSSTICVQDGKDAGQTISHVHCHILPRKEGDFQRNDDIYVELAKHDRDNNPQPIRSLEEMSKEADLLRKYF